MNAETPRIKSRTEDIVAELHRPGSTRESVAAVYGHGIVESQRHHDSQYVDWPTVNRALLKRYTPSGLNYIKALGWKVWERTHAV